MLRNVFQCARALEELSCIQTPGKTALVSLGSHFWLYAVVATNGLAWSREGRPAFLFRSCTGVQELEVRTRREEGVKTGGNAIYYTFKWLF